VDALVQRVRGLATAMMSFVERDGDARDDPDRPAIRISPTAQWMLWAALLILPGSFLLIPVLIWGKLLPPRVRLSRP
jgi:hypothetical protein